jgi:diketogulonate reductase-like aldo/keto reductase
MLIAAQAAQKLSVTTVTARYASFKFTMANTPIKLNGGTTIPLLAFGTGTAHVRTDVQDTVTKAINAGFTHFDGAQLYKNEQYLGAGIAAAGKPREQLFITTKLAKPAEGKTVRDTLVESLKKLQVDYVNLFLIHIPLRFPGGLKAVWKEMEAVKKEGLTRSIGVSNCRSAQLREILDGAEIPPSINQVSHQVLTPCDANVRSADRVSSVCLREHTIHASAAETIRDRHCVIWRTLAYFPLQWRAARPRVDVYRKEGLRHNGKTI